MPMFRRRARSVSIRRFNPTGQRAGAIVREDTAVERMERRVVDVGRELPFVSRTHASFPPLALGAQLSLTMLVSLKNASKRLLILCVIALLAVPGYAVLLLILDIAAEPTERQFPPPARRASSGSIWSRVRTMPSMTAWPFGSPSPPTARSAACGWILRTVTLSPWSSSLVTPGSRRPSRALWARPSSLSPLYPTHSPAPPLGVRADMLIFLWAELANVVGFTLFVTAWARKGPKSNTPSG
jgi:hypothetical protein